MLLSPVYSISTLYTTVNRNLGKKNSTLIETYPEYKEYEKIFGLLDGVSDAIDFELGIFDALGYPLDALSLGSYSSLNSDLASVDKHLGMLKTSGITVIYTIDKISTFTSALIHGAVLYLDYILLYLFNGWLQSSLKPIMIFTICFVLGYLIIWAIVFVVTRKCTEKLNESLN